MATYLIKYCNPNTFRAVVESIEKLPEGLTKMHMLVHKLPSDMMGVYARYHIEAIDRDLYMNLRFSTNSLSIETNCSKSGMAGLLDKLAKFTKGSLTIDDAVAILQSTG